MAADTATSTLTVPDTVGVPGEALLDLLAFAYAATDVISELSGASTDALYGVDKGWEPLRTRLEQAVPGGDGPGEPVFGAITNRANEFEAEINALERPVGAQLREASESIDELQARLDVIEDRVLGRRNA